MQTRFKHIHFKEDTWGAHPERPKVYQCRNNKSGDLLGRVTYYDGWKRWVFDGKQCCVFDSSCLRDIAMFLDSLKD